MYDNKYTKTIVQRIIDVGSHVNEDSSTQEELRYYDELVIELDNNVTFLTQEESISLLSYLGKQNRDPAFGMNTLLVDIVEGRSAGYPHQDAFLLLPSSEVTINTKIGTYEDNYFTASDTFTNKVEARKYEKLLSKTKSLQNVNEARFLASLVFYVVNEEGLKLNDKYAKRIKELLEPFASEVDDWVDEEKEGLRILGLLDAR